MASVTQWPKIRRSFGSNLLRSASRPNSVTQTTSVGRRKYQYLLNKGENYQVCNEMESASDDKLVTKSGCVHYSGK